MPTVDARRTKNGRQKNDGTNLRGRKMAGRKMETGGQETRRARTPCGRSNRYSFFLLNRSPTVLPTLLIVFVATLEAVSVTAFPMSATPFSTALRVLTVTS